MCILEKREIKIFLIFFIIFALFTHWWGWDENSRFNLTRSIVDGGKLEIDDYANNTADRAYYKGHYYCEKEPSISLISIPIYASWKVFYNIVFPEPFKEADRDSSQYECRDIGKTKICNDVSLSFFNAFSMFLVTIFTSSLFTALTILLLYRISKYFTKKEDERLFIIVIYGLGSLAFQYALVFLSHSIATFLCFFSFYLLFKCKKERKKSNIYFIIAGFTSGLAISFGLSAFFIFVGILFYCFRIDKKKITIFILFAFLGTFPYLIYNYAIFDNPLSFGYSHTDPEVWTDMGLTNKMGFISSLPNPFISMKLLFYPYRGLFFYYPVLLLSIPGFLYLFRKNKDESILALYSLLSMVLIFSMFWSWYGGAVFGPRHLMPAIPFLMLPILMTIKKLDKRIIIILLSLSILVNFIGLQQVEDDIIEHTTLYPKAEYFEKMNSLETIGNPIFTHYLPEFFINGPRSMVIESILDPHRNFDIRYPIGEMGITPLKEIPLFKSEFGFFNLNVRLIPLYLILLSFLIIFKPEISNKLKKFHVLPLIAFVILIPLLFFNFSSMTFESNWHQEEITESVGESTHYRWMSQNATISLFVPKGYDKPIGFYVWVYFKPRTLVVYLNHSNFTFKNVIGSRTLIIPFVENDSFEKIRFYSEEGCDVVQKVENKNDPRCLSFSLAYPPLYWEKIENNILFGENWFTEEAVYGLSWRWMSNNASLMIYKEKDEKMKLFLELRAYHKPRKLMVNLNGETVGEYEISLNKKNLIIEMNLKEGKNIINLISSEGCDIPDIIEGSHDSRCLSFAFTEIEIK